MGFFSRKKEEKKEDIVEQIDEKKVVKTKQVSKKDTKEQKSEKEDIASTASAYGIVIVPVMTEKSHDMIAKNKYTFRVAKNASKVYVKNVIEEMYGVHVENVNIVVVKPKRRTVKYNRGYQKLYKKAIVTVREGDHITVFEGA